MGMFDNYENIDNSCKPNNRHMFCEIDKTDEIIIGGTSTHVFTLFFDYTKMCREENWLAITYKQSLGKYESSEPTDAYEETFNIQSPYVSVNVQNNITHVTVQLPPEVTSKFAMFKSTFAQIKLFMKDGTTIYGDKNNIRVIDTLDGGIK